MKEIHRPFRIVFLAVLVWGLLSGGALADSGKKPRNGGDARSIHPERLLLLGPTPHPLPVFHESERGGYDLEKLLDEAILPDPRVRPREGDGLAWHTGTPLAWRSREAARSGRLPLARPDGGGPAIAWALAYLEVDRWRSYELRLLGEHPRRAWLDGEPLTEGGLTEEDDGEVESEIKLVTGKHTLLIETILDPDREAEWTVGAEIRTEGDDLPRIRFSLEPDHPVTLSDVLDPPRITSLALAPDGRRVAVSVSRVLPGTDESESWIEIRRTSDGTPTESWRGGRGVRSVAWSPDGRYLSYVADAPGAEEDDRSSLYLYDRENDSASPLLEGIAELGSYLWSPTGTAIVYEVEQKAEKDERGVKLLEGLMDRWATHRDRRFLHLVGVPGGARRQLTSGPVTTSATGFSPDGTRLLFTRIVEDPSERPYSATELWELDLETFEPKKLRRFGWFNDAIYSPDGRTILIAADSEAFGDAGRNLPEGVIPNSYDVQLFLWDPATDAVEPLTRDFDPAVDQVAWSREDGNIYFTAGDRDFVRLYRYAPETGEFTVLATGHDRFHDLDLAPDVPVAAGLGSSPWVPQNLVVVDLSTDRARTLAHPADSWFSDVRPGGLEEWEFTASSGKRIPGRIYLPQGFDPDRRYPAIVYYYGGTLPVTREFGGRYPKEWWASNGYVVYVLQPSGATGFGQSWSAAHVNDWGRITAEEILEGTKAFLEAHPYVDPERVGCIGASYGGFMTMLLTTRTDLFAAAVSHAGISSLASYWGEGYWGYSYSAVATADSFPWNRPDLYIGQSPLFRADRTRVPILLTHGSADTNVPIGESDQFYVALKLLGKEVEYLQVEGQDHYILEHEKRKVWSSSIVAWFDRWLKGQPEWWNDLFPSRAVKDEKSEGD